MNEQIKYIDEVQAGINFDENNDFLIGYNASESKIIKKYKINVLNVQLLDEKGQVNGYAGLDSTGKVPASQLPSYVDDVLEYDSQSDFPAAGETGKIYIAKDTGKTYRWSGSTYIEINNPTAIDVPTDTSNFSNIFSSSEDNVQKALQHLDDIFAYGEFTPSKLDSSNLDSYSFYGGKYTKIGNIVQFSVRASIKATAANTVKLYFSMPISSNFANGYDAIGTISQKSTGVNIQGAVYAYASSPISLCLEVNGLAAGQAIGVQCNITYIIK